MCSQCDATQCHECSTQLDDHVEYIYAPYTSTTGDDMLCYVPHCIEASDDDPRHCLTCDPTGPLPYWSMADGVCTDDCSSIHPGMVNPDDDDDTNQC